MKQFSRRTFLGTSLAAASILHHPGVLMAQTACVSGNLPTFSPTTLSVDCASRKNFQLFRKNSDHVGLAGVVSMTFVRGKWGEYQAGNLFLFPWLKRKGQALGLTKDWQSVFPANGAQVMSAAPIRGETLPTDEYFCRYVLNAPPSMFIGFSVDVPFRKDHSKRDWANNVDKLSDGKGVGIDWSSHNLNQSWFGGSRWIPSTDKCGGKTWRNVIVAGLKVASTPAC